MGIEPESWNKDQGPFYAGGFNGMDDHQVMFRPPKICTKTPLQVKKSIFTISKIKLLFIPRHQQHKKVQLCSCRCLKSSG